MKGKILAALLSGVVFGIGLSVSGLADPDNVLRFLTVAPGWSPAPCSTRLSR